ncbi:MAG TPA: aspartate dehydrogenase [Burkholderiaceae bacterium]|nr:aspartate dehydrogenase [Burkholderiaceae bacterium]
MTHRIAFIGFGTIGRDVARGLREHAGYRLAALCRRADAPLDADMERLPTFQDLRHWEPGLVVEVASQKAVHEYAASVLRAGIPFLVSSVGALADSTYVAHLREVAGASRARIIVPSGAVASLDYLRAIRTDPSAGVTYESRKPVAAWEHELRAAGHDPSALTHELVLYEGPADVAARKYPKNLNVAATLALAGVGMDRTRVRVVADPGISRNQHAVHVTGAAGSLQTQVINQPAPSNPKTSAVVARSVCAAINHYFDPLLFI